METTTNRTRLGLIVLGLIIAAIVAGVFVLSGDDTDSKKDTVVNDEGEELQNVTLYLTFQPNIQFSPVYVAIDNGYFADEGLNVSVEYIFESAIVDGLAINQMQFGILGGEQVLLARRAEKSLVYVMEWYHRFPVGIVVPANSDIEEPADLSGKHVSLPAAEGASYMGWRALLTAADLSEDDVETSVVGFAAKEQMCEENVDAAVVYIANEPLQIASDCYEVRVIEISDYTNLVANGLVTNEQTIADNPELVFKMTRAFQRGIEFTINNPDEAFDIGLTRLPELAESQYDVQREVLARSIDLWVSENPGQTSIERWQTTEDTLVDAGLLQEAFSVEGLKAAYSNGFLPAVEE